jgi:hypothetical protein
MSQQFVFWKPFKTKNVKGKDISLELPQLIDRENNRNLLSKILNMPKNTPLGFNEAIAMVYEAQRQQFDASNFGSAPGQYGWYAENFVDWISSLGYHIELTGDEFEATVAQEHVA